jgi:hypothetical protein
LVFGFAENQFLPTLNTLQSPVIANVVKQSQILNRTPMNFFIDFLFGIPRVAEALAEALLQKETKKSSPFKPTRRERQNFRPLRKALKREHCCDFSNQHKGFLLEIFASSIRP